MNDLNNPSQEHPEVHEPEMVVIAEMTVDELNQPAESPDPITGLPRTRLDELREQEAQKHGGRLFTQIGDRLSEGAKATNKLLHNKNVRRGAKAGAFMIAVVAVRAGKKHYDNSSEE